MRFIKYDYLETSANDYGMDDIWDAHWRGREGLKEDLSTEPLWPTIEDQLHPPGYLLEAGCGTGQWVQFLQNLGHEVIGIDFAQSGIDVGLKHNPDLNLMQTDFRKLPFEDGFFDYIVSFGAVEHDIDGPEAALREFRRVMKPNGKLMCSVPCLNLYRIMSLPWMIIEKRLKCSKVIRLLWGKERPFTFYEYIWSTGEYIDILRKCGYEVLYLRGYGSTIKNSFTRFLDKIANRIDPLSSVHMMMAICKRSESVS